MPQYLQKRICGSISVRYPCGSLFFFFNDTATTEIYTLSLHDALPISLVRESLSSGPKRRIQYLSRAEIGPKRSEEHTSELQSRLHLVCRLLLEKKKDHHRPPTLAPPLAVPQPSHVSAENTSSDPQARH